MTTLLVDGPNLWSRAAFAARGKGVALSVEHEETGALLLAINLLSKYVRLTGAQRILVCWDRGHVFRNQVLPEYKQARKAAPGEEKLSRKTGRFEQFLELAGIHQAVAPEWEADDIIAMVTRRFSGVPEYGLGDTVILSGDKDLLQLVDDARRITQVRIPDETVMNEAAVVEKMGCQPWQLPYLMALTGDTIDGVPGVRGLGPKKALKVMEEAGWLVGQWATDASLAKLGMSRDAAMTVPMFSAGFTGLDLRNERSREFLRRWHAAAQDGVSFIGPWTNQDRKCSADPRVLGHRHDMTAASIIAHKLGMVPAKPTFMAYDGPGPFAETVCIRARGM